MGLGWPTTRENKYHYNCYVATIGIGGKIQPEPKKFPQVLMDSYFAGQFDLSKKTVISTKARL